MIVLGFVLLIAVLAAGGNAWLAMSLRRPWLTKRTGSPVIVHCRDGQSIQGVILKVWHDGVLLAAPKHLDEGSVALSGHAFIGRENIAFVQLL